MPPISESAVLDALRPIVDPDFGKNDLCFGDDLIGEVSVELLELRPH